MPGTIGKDNSMFVKSWGENVFLTEKNTFNTHLVDQDVSYVTFVVEFSVWPSLLRHHTTTNANLITCGMLSHLSTSFY